MRAPLGQLLRSELRWVLRRPRTQVTLGLLALVPVLIGIGIVVTDSPAGGLLTQIAGNGLVLPVAALSISLPLLLPLAVTMAAADALAGESAHGTLRGLLLAPVSRPRLVLVPCTVRFIRRIATSYANSKSDATLTINTGTAGTMNVKFFIGTRADSFFFDVVRYFQVRAFLAQRFSAARAARRATRRPRCPRTAAAIHCSSKARTARTPTPSTSGTRRAARPTSRRTSTSSTP